MPYFEEIRKKLGAQGGGLSLLGGCTGRTDSGQLGEKFSVCPRVFAHDERFGQQVEAHIDRAFHRREDLPPVVLYKLVNSYLVSDGNHRESEARYHGVEMIEAEVAEFGAPRRSCAAGIAGDERVG